MDNLDSSKTSHTGDSEDSKAGDSEDSKAGDSGDSKAGDSGDSKAEDSEDSKAEDSDEQKTAVVGNIINQGYSTNVFTSDVGNQIDDSYSLIGNPDRLKKELDHTQNEIAEKEREYDNLDARIKKNKKDLDDKIDPEDKYTLEKRIKEQEGKRKTLEKALYKLEDKKYSLEQRLEKAEKLKNKKNKSQADIEESSREAEEIQARDLFQENEPIENTVLYVATFFPDLSPQDFEQVVSYLLKQRNTQSKVQTKKTTERGETYWIEEDKDKPLEEIWQDSLYQPEKYLGKCYLKSEIQEDYSQIIEFYIPLRDKFKIFFKEQQSLYLSVQFKRVRYLLFNESENIAKNAMELAIEMAITSPSAYGEDWLFDIVIELTREIKNFKKVSEALEHLDNKPPKTREEIIFGRISSLITQMLDYSQLEDIANQFLQKLFNESRFKEVIQIVRRLDSAPKSEQLDWLKLLINQKKDNKVRDEAEFLLYNELKENIYPIYKLLEIIKSWVPEVDLSIEKYSESNKFSLLLVFLYCSEMTYGIEVEDYGCWQDKDKYPLFASLISDSSDDKLKLEDKLEIIITYLFHPKLEDILKEENIITEEELDITQKEEQRDKLNEAIVVISLFITEWSKLLIPDEKWFSFEKIDSKPIDTKASKIFDALLKTIIEKTSIKQQKQLLYAWTLVRNYYLEESQFYEDINDNKLKKQANLNRKNVRRVRKKFKALQKEIKQS